MPNALARAFVVAGIAGGAASPAALGQSFSGMGPATPFMLPSPDRPTPARAPTAAAPAPMPKQAPTTARPLRHLPAHPNGLRLAGEAAALDWPLVVSAAEARAGGSFQVSYRAAVAVLPEASTLQVTVNGVRIGAASVRSSGGSRSVSFEIPPGRLAAGANALRIAVDQRHRVDCSLAATYELWTDIGPDGTGFLPAGGAADGPASLAGLAALRFDSSGALPIRVVQAAGRMTPQAVERALSAVGAIAVAARAAHPVVEFGPPAVGPFGLNILVGTVESLAGLTEPGSLGSGAGGVVRVLPATPDRRTTLVVSGASDADLDRALADLSAAAAEPVGGSPEGLAALANFPGRRIVGGTTLTLGELGIGRAEISGRHARLRFNLLAPPDFLSADYDKLTLDLAGRYADGLAPGARLSIEVNGVAAASVALGGKAGEFGHKQVYLPLSALRPGLNRLAIAAELPTRADATCSATSTSGPPRLVLHEGTAVIVPALARIGWSPNLANASLAGLPFVGGRRPRLYVPRPDRATMGAAATLAARIGAAAGQVIPFEFVTAEPAPGGPVLAVSPAPALSFAAVTAAGLDAERLHAAWTARPGARSATPTIADRLPGSGRPPVIEACRAPVEPAREPVDPETVGSIGAAAEASMDASVRRGLGWVMRLRSWASRLFSVPTAQAGAESGGPVGYERASLAIGQGLTGPAPDDVLTVVTAPSSAALNAAVRCLADPRVWSQLGGQASTLDIERGAIGSSEPQEARLVRTESLGLGNVRRIAAGWLSLAPSGFAALALIVALVLAGATHWLVGNVGRRHG